MVVLKCLYLNVRFLMRVINEGNVMSVIELTSANFKQVVEENAFVIVDFWAEWCEPCVRFLEVYQTVSNQTPDIVFGKLNTDDYPDIAAYFEVKQVPCIFAIRDQVIIDGQVGEVTQKKFVEMIQMWRAFDNAEINKHFDAKLMA